MKPIHLFFLTLVLLAFSGRSKAQFITTFAGNYSLGHTYTGDGGAATAAGCSDIFDVKVDGSGNVYFSEANNNVIRKVNTAGIISTFAGNGYMAGVGSGAGGYTGDGGPATDAELDEPTGMTIDAAGNVYFVDYRNGVVRKVNTAGIISTFAGHFGSGASGDGGPATNATLQSPFGLAIDAAGNVYIGVSTGVRMVNTSGIISTFAGNGTIGYSGDSGPATSAQFWGVSGMVFDASGNLFVADKQNNLVRKINTSRIVTTVAGNNVLGYSGDGGPATAAQLHWPIYVALDPTGNLLIADWWNSVIRKVNNIGIISTIAGNGSLGFSGDGGPAGDASFHWSCAMAYDAVGRLYIADQLNNVVRRVDTTSDNFPAFSSTGAGRISICSDSISVNLDTLLAAIDLDMGQTEKWTVRRPPFNGTLAGFPYSLTSSGGSLYPLGLSYTPVTGFSGLDSFVIEVSDSIAVAVTTIFVTVNNCSLDVNSITRDGSDIAVYPNPSSGNFTIEFPISGSKAYCTISDLLGRTVAANIVETKSGKNIKYTFTGIPSGQYILKVDNGITSYRKKVLVE